VAIESALLIVGAYLLGSVPAAYLAAKYSRGIDIRQYGPGHVGVGSIWTIISKKVALPVIIFDLGKGAGMVVAARLVGLDITGQVAVGLAAIVGHNWPVFLRFNGGRGILTALGVICIWWIPWWIPWGLVTFLAGASLTLLGRGSPLPVLIGIAAIPVVSWVLGQPLAITLGFLALLLIVVIRRLTVPRSDSALSISKRQLLLNRLLFDRDIRERGDWMSRIPKDANLTEAEKARLQKERQKKGLFK